MDPALRSLVDLQEMLNEQGHLRRRYAEIPQEIEDMKRDRQLLEERRREHEEAFHAMEKKEKTCEQDLASTEEAIRKKQATMHEVKNNKEYAAALSEIETLKQKKSDLEEETLTLMDTIAEDRRIFREEGESIAAEEKRLDDRIKEKELERRQAAERANEIARLVPEQQKTILPQLLEQFKKLYYGRNGIALVSVSDGCCGGCMIALSPQTINAAGMGDRIVTCDHCGRILYTDRQEE
jgi:predicted  nucleic acid-binding Zn-ribbon protein